MGSSSEVPAAPDLSPLTNFLKESATASGQYANEQMQWAKDAFAKNSTNTDAAINELRANSAAANDRAKSYYDEWNDTYKPAQEKYLADAEGYDTGERRAQAAGEAVSGVGQQFEAARNNATRQLESYGVNPAATRFAALDIGTRTQEAAAKATAANKAVQDTEARGYQLRQGAIQQGQGLQGAATSDASLANNGQTAAVNADLATTASGASTMGTGTQWTTLGNSAITGAGSLTNQGYQNQVAATEANNKASSGIGSALGTVAGLGMSFMGMPTGSIGGKMLGFAEGGDVPDQTPGGAIPMGASPSGGEATDDVPASLTAGEFVIPKDVAGWIGEKSFQQLIQKARAEKEKAQAKPAIGPGAGGPPAVVSRPNGAIPMGA